MRNFFPVLLSFLILAHAASAATNWSQPPNEAANREELLNYFGASQGFGPVQRAEFNRFGRQIFAVWYCPFSGRNTCYLHVYYYDPATTRWILFMNRMIQGTSDLSPEMPSSKDLLIFRDSNDKIIISESVKKLPAEKER